MSCICGSPIFLGCPVFGGSPIFAVVLYSWDVLYLRGTCTVAKARARAGVYYKWDTENMGHPGVGQRGKYQSQTYMYLRKGVRDLIIWKMERCKRLGGGGDGGRREGE